MQAATWRGSPYSAGFESPTVRAGLGSTISRTVLGYPYHAFTTRGRGGRSATARDVGGHARPLEPASGVP